jgi:N-dimethylarginine dimethylaminohydrolase
MCKPTYYTIAYEINPWMRVQRQVARTRALRQWTALHHLLTKRLKLSVRLLPPVNGLPDLVFTANAGLLVGRTFIRSNFRYPERQGEEAVCARYFRQLGFRVLTLPRMHNFEGEGDALWLGRTLFLGFRFRSDAASHERLSALLQREVLPVELKDKRFYHLDTCFCPLGPSTLLWYPKAFDRYGRKVIEDRAQDAIAVSEADARKFACNAIVAGRELVCHRGLSQRLRRQLTKRGYAVHELDLSEFMKAGGSAKCLVLTLRKTSDIETTLEESNDDIHHRRFVTLKEYLAGKRS